MAERTSAPRRRADDGYALLLGAEDDGVLVGTRRRLLAGGTPAYLVSDLARIGVSIPLAAAGAEGALVVDGVRLSLSAVRAIVVSELTSIPPAPMRRDDAAYVQEEIRAAWLGLLASAVCKVVNRPAAWPPLLYEPWQLRVFARKRGIPTVEEEVVAASALASRPDMTAAVDLVSAQTFWLTDDAMLPHDGVYSVVGVRRDARYAIAIRVGRHLLAFVFDPSRDELRPSRSLRPRLLALSDALLAPLGIDYAFCVFVETGGELAFSRLFTAPPPFLADRLDERVSRLLAAELGA